MNRLTPRRLKIAIASSGLGHVARGIEAWAGDLAAALANRGQDVALFKGAGVPQADYERVLPCWRRSEPRTERLIRWLPKSCWHFGVGTVYDVEQLTFVARLIQRLRRDRIDVLHVQDPQLALQTQRAARIGLTRTAVVLGHGTNESGEFLKKIEYLQHLSPWQLEEWRRAGIHRGTWRAIPNFVDIDCYRPGRAPGIRAELGIPPEAVVVLSVAAVKRDHKRIDHLLAEFAQLRAAHPAAPLWLVVAGGRESDTDALVRDGRELLGDRVRFLVQFPRLRIPDLYRAADVFVLCSLREMMPIALIEATASGLPCLVHDHPVMTWIAGASAAVDMKAPGSLSAALASLALNSPQRKLAGEANRDRAVALFGRDRIVGEILDHYAFCVAHRRTASKVRVGRGATV